MLVPLEGIFLDFTTSEGVPPRKRTVRTAPLYQRVECGSVRRPTPGAELGLVLLDRARLISGLAKFECKCEGSRFLQLRESLFVV